MNSLPNCLIVGAAKAGTSSLYKYLSSHSDSLRNPVERSFSAYLHLVRDKRETYSFKKALNLEEERIKSRYEFIWHYKQASMYSAAVKAYLENFTNVLIVFQEDLNQDSSKVLESIINFLCITTHEKGLIQRNTQTRQNVSKVPKYKFIDELLFNKHKLPLYDQIKQRLQPWEKSIKATLTNIRHKNKFKPTLPNSIRFELQEFFNEDQRQLTQILNIQKVPYSWLEV